MIAEGVTLIRAVVTIAPDGVWVTDPLTPVRKPDMVAPLPFLTDAPACA
jgi:hypothetical protein